MHNFCLDRDGNYVVADVPAVIVGDESVTPLSIVGDDIICCRGKELLSVDVRGGEPDFIGALSGVPQCAAVVGDVVVVMCDGCSHRVIRDSRGKFVLLPDISCLPFRFEASHGAVFSVGVGQPFLSKLGDACVEAYCDAVGRAAGVGMLTAPVMARYKLYDAYGNEVYSSVPVVLGENGASLYTFKVVEDDKGNRTAVVGDMAFGAYLLRVDIGEMPAAVWRDYIAEMRVEVTKPFHGVSSGEASLLFSRDNTEVTLRMPGGTRALNAAMMSATIARFDSISTVVASIPFPFKSDGGIDIPIFTSGNAVTVSDAIAVSLCKPISDYAVTSYNSFVARGCAVNAGGVLWRGIKGIHAPAPSPFAMAKTVGNRRWHAYVRVQLADGDCVINGYEGEREPLALSPLIAWPQPNAVSMTIEMNIDGDDDVQTLTVPLHNDTSGKYSIYAEPNGRAISFISGGEKIDLGEAQSSAKYDDTAMIVASREAPLQARQIINTDSCVHAVTAACSSGGAWDFGRARFYAFTDTGVFIVAVERRFTATSVAILTYDRVSSPSRITECGKAICYLTDDGLLKRLSGTQSTMIDDAVPGDAVAFSSTLDSVYVLDSDDNQCRVYPLHRAKEYARVNGGNAFYTQDCISRHCDLSLPIGLCVTDKGMVDFGNPQRPTASVEGCVVSLPVKYSDIMAVNLLTSKVSGEILLTRHYVTRGRCATIAQVQINGCFTSPIQLPLSVLSPTATWVTLRGTFSPDSRVHQ